MKVFKCQSLFRSPLFITSCHVCHSCSSVSIVGLLACFASSVLSSMVIRARGAHPRPLDSSTPPGFTTAPQRQEGQQFPLGTICHGDVPLWPSQRGRLECVRVCRQAPRRNPRCADVGTRVRKRKREQHHKHTARNTTRVLAKRCNRSALVRRKHPSVERSREPPDILGRFLFVASRNSTTRSPWRHGA